MDSREHNLCLVDKVAQKVLSFVTVLYILGSSRILFGSKSR